MKYNWSIIGHEKQLLRIERDIESGNLAHAYLLAGPNSIGKNTVAKKMAGILQCENDFCHQCNTCLQIQKNAHLDTMVLKDDHTALKIEEVRNVTERMNMTRQSPYKIVLIQRIERMTTEAANSFLKVLEEPPPRTVFIMTTNNIDELLPTVVSRVRVVKFTAFSQKYLNERLRDLYPDKDSEDLNKAGLFSMGRSGKAIHLLEDSLALAGYMEIYNKIQNFLAYKSRTERFAYVESLLEEPKNVEIFFNILRSVLRTKVLEGKDEGEKYANTLSKIDDTAILIEKNVNTRLALENLMLCI